MAKYYIIKYYIKYPIEDNERKVRKKGISYCKG